MNTPNLHAFEITYLGATNTKGSRVKIKSLRFNEAKIIDYDYNYSNTLDIAKAWLEDYSYELAGQAETPKSYIILSTTFKPLK